MIFDCRHARIPKITDGKQSLWLRCEQARKQAWVYMITLHVAGKWLALLLPTSTPRPVVLTYVVRGFLKSIRKMP
jgi:hypothetical protein